ncbi:protein FAR1-RELATED SEQUENCE 5-like [Rutidosis leptorrhynchoides]|uniref:protein FAR1-RELATED SEQUENCE 5-like n=1 Tax=Rutidosis leptorrhynchoides TaxID=125765 RepID=UPI003A992D91
MGMKFETVEDAWQFWVNYGARIGFDVRKEWSNKNKNDQRITSARFVCNKQGFRKTDKRDHQTKCPRAETRTNCGSRMGIIFNKDTQKYKITDFVREHNHMLHTPETVHMMSSQRKISQVQAMEIDLVNDSGIKTKASYELMSRRGGGKSSVGYTYIDKKNYIGRKRQRELKYGEAGTLLRYFQQQSLENPSFFYATQLDSEEQITNIFWADARMIMDYSYFGDVVTFDTTYKTNNQYRPLGVFIGFNHHKGITVFGGSLLYDETIESFEWLFRTFLEAHNNKKPITIFTDQDQAMASALVNIMPNVHHGLCTWHIMQNAIKHVGNIVKDDRRLLKDFKKCMYQYDDQQKFEKKWETIIDYYNVKENTWLKGIYEKKEKWAKCYMNDVFTLGMRSTQLSESLNGDLKDYLNCELNILDFFKNFVRVVEDKRYNELKAEFDSRQKLPRVRMPKSPLLQQVARVYTPSVFELFEEEFDWSLSASIKHHNETCNVYTYVIGMFNQYGEYIVTINPSENTICCSCKKFETFGYLCSHSLKVLNVMDIKILPEKYILKRWSREAKNESVQDVNGKEVHADANLSATQRYRYLCSILVKLASKASQYEETYDFLGRASNELCKQVESMCVNLNKVTVENSGVDGSSSKSKDKKENDESPSNVKGIKKTAGQKGRRRPKSWVEKLPKKKKNDIDSVADKVFEKFKGFLCDAQAYNLNHSFQLSQDTRTLLNNVDTRNGNQDSNITSHMN